MFSFINKMSCFKFPRVDRPQTPAPVVFRVAQKPLDPLTLKCVTFFEYEFIMGSTKMLAWSDIFVWTLQALSDTRVRILLLVNSGLSNNLILVNLSIIQYTYKTSENRGGGAIRNPFSPYPCPLPILNPPRRPLKNRVKYTALARMHNAYTRPHG